MAYAFQQDGSVEAAVKRVAREQVDGAIDEINDRDLDQHTTVHEVRKCCKKVRGLLRLVRPALGDTYQDENARFRDAARNLSGVRDTAVMIETYDKLMDRYDDEIDRPAFAPVRRELTMERKIIEGHEADVAERLRGFLEEMREAQDRIDGWTLSEDGFEAIEDGLRKTYKRGRKAMEAAYDDPSVERFHEWRKREKYHWYHVRLLQDIWPGVMGGREATLDHLSDLLGDDHDLAVFGETVHGDPGKFNIEQELPALMTLVDRRRAELQAEARLLGLRAYAEKPGQLTRSFSRYWEAWQSETKLESTPAAV